jgi:hypothetical protein
MLLLIALDRMKTMAERDPCETNAPLRCLLWPALTPLHHHVAGSITVGHR